MPHKCGGVRTTLLGILRIMALNIVRMVMAHLEVYPRAPLFESGFISSHQAVYHNLRTLYTSRLVNSAH
tara:strand:- start:702 stop:908 length:207 start_codon:yes stop_codon:yes gene_type:complete